MDGRLERRWPELAPLLDTLLALAPALRAQERQRLDLDAELAELLDTLLAGDAAAGDALETVCSELRDEAQPALDAPPLIPGYRVLQFVGAGGMASVFLAERALHGAQQRVALKLLRLNVHDPAERGLFRREQAALARLEHDNIARLIDSGFAADGAPWLATEYVDGDNLLAWCDARRLPLRARVAVFLEVCAAVTAAHQALIVHRDLKPANVLVRADGHVKLVDFGIAKLLEAGTEAARTELRRLTPAYAAPEQLRGEPVGAGADIYALGVMLAELLAGTRPQPRRDGSVVRLDTHRIAAAQAQARGLEPAGLRRLLRGDLDAIVARALRAEPRERYASVDALAADLRAWRECRPVQARRGSRRYRLACFLRRNRLALVLGTLAAAALLGFSAVSLQLAHRAELAAAQSRADAQRARRVQDFVLSLFRGDETGLAEGRATSAAELVERALRAARQDFRDQPESLVALLTAVGELERHLGRNAQSTDTLEQAVALALQQFGPGQTATLQAQAELAHTRFRSGAYVQAAAQLTAALDAYRAAGGGESEALVAALVRLGMLQAQLGQEDQALAQLEQAVQLGRLVHGGDHPALQRAMEIHGGALADSGQLDRAADVLEQNLALTRRLYGSAHLIVASALESLAVVQMRRGRLAPAALLIGEAETILREKAPATHTMNAYVANTAGVIALQRGDTPAAQQAFGRALAVYRALHPGDHPMTAATLGNLGQAAEESADAAAAAAHFAEALRISVAVRPATDFRLPDFRCRHARALDDQAKPAAAEFDTALAQFAQLPAPAPLLQADCLGHAAQSRLRRGEAAAATGLAAQALALLDAQPRQAARRLRLQRLQAEAALLQRRDDAATAAVQAALALDLLSTTPRQSAAEWKALAGVAEHLGLAADAAAARERAARLAAVATSPDAPVSSGTPR